MTNREKAIKFLELTKDEPQGCNAVLTILSMMFGISIAECFEKIKELAESTN